MRRLFLLLAVAVPGLVFAQDLQSARVMMEGALAELATHKQLSLVLSGTENDGGREHKFSAVLSIEFSIQNGRQVAKMELLDYRDNQLQKRVAADGERFWAYDLKGKVYTSTEYGTAAYVGKEKERLFQNMLLRLKGEQTFLARLVKDAFGGTLNASSAWMPWRPSSKVSVQGENIVCASTAPTANTLTYALEPVIGFGYALKGVDYTEQTLISGRVRSTQWTVSIFRDQLAQGTSWFFVPPAGSRAVSVNEIGG